MGSKTYMSKINLQRGKLTVEIYAVLSLSSLCIEIADVTLEHISGRFSYAPIFTGHMCLKTLTTRFLWPIS